MKENLVDLLRGVSPYDLGAVRAAEKTFLARIGDTSAWPALSPAQEDNGRWDS